MAYTKITLLALAAALSVARGSPVAGYGGVVVDAGLGAAQSYSRLSVPVAASSVVVVEPEIIAYPRYGFKYGVEDPKTGDVKDQAEERDGDVVKGEYSLLQPDGRKRVVSYVSDKVNGFNAVVSYSGEAVHPQVVKVDPVQVQVPLKVASYGAALSSAY
ncbi:cuticle protein 19-like [Frankliniella occidentalis]|uniref:Cuticle protein 19-like n=1 Tax=Frankliniella occidentalis TaxID=133901 RepID=A0A9C6U7T1_FRAOC|nr:cuticle protein 19-like [Frankliniella occidentalis]